MFSDYVLPLDHYLYTWYSSCVLHEITYLSGPTCAPLVTYLCGYTCALATCLYGCTCIPLVTCVPLGPTCALLVTCHYTKR